MLSVLNTPNKKVITLEDPIEYELPQVVQSEINEKK
jgi:MSHA biogenesis protein MshE